MNLRPYQEEDVIFLSNRNRAACFNEQRTGKTPILLTVIERRKLDKILIICPKSAIPVWKGEIKKWTPQYYAKTTLITGTRTRKEKQVNEWESGIIIISYDSFKATKKSNGLLYEILAKSPNAIIIDEAHRIQNRKTAVTKALFLTLRIKIRYALTGTAVLNRAYKIWPILHWLYPEYFRGYWKFIKEYFYSREMTNPQTGKEFIKEGIIRQDKKTQLWELLNKFCTQRKRKDVMPWLPKKDPIPIILEPTSLQIKYLNEMQEYYELEESEEVIAQNKLTQLMYYRMICLDPGVLKLKSRSPKNDWIMDYIDDYPEEKILIFSFFTSYLKKLKARIVDAGYKVDLIDGSVSETRREEIVDQFQNHDTRILLLQIATAKEALTLDAATTEIFPDRYPPIGAIEQAEDRFIATTPEKADKPHKIFQLILEGTYDETIDQMLRELKNEIEIINDFKNKLKERKI
jgi:SNF2 family DNA or RNA helicase